MNDLRLVLRHIGGTSAVSWQAFIVSSVLSVFTYLGGSDPPSDRPLTWLTILAVAQALGFMPLVITKRLLGSTLSTRPRPYLMLSLYMLVAVIRGVVLDTGLLWSGAEAESVVLFRVFAAMPTMVVALSATAVIVGSAREHRSRLAQLITVNAALEQTQARIEQDLADEQSRALEQITADLQHEVDELDPNRPHESAEMLHHLAAGIVRPLSHELANAVPTWKPREVPIEVPKVRAWEVISRVPAGRPFMPVATAAALVSAGLGTAIVLLGVPVAVAALAVGAPIAIAVLTVFNAAMAAIRSTWPSWIRPVAFVVFTVLASVAAAVFTTIMLPPGPDADRLIPSTFRYGLVTVLLLATMKAYWTVRGDVLESLEKRGEKLRWSVVRARQVQWFRQRAISRILHGPVQSVLNAAAMRVDAARAKGNAMTPVLDDARRELQDVFDLMRTSETGSASLSVSIEQWSAVWSALCDIRFDVEPDANHALEQDPVCRTIVSEIITEGISNAIRHGAAHNIDITVARRGEGLVRLTIANDGMPPREDSGAGLGSRLLDECAIAWRREQRSSSTVLKADLPTGR